MVTWKASEGQTADATVRLSQIGKFRRERGRAISGVVAIAVNS